MFDSGIPFPSWSFTGGRICSKSGPDSTRDLTNPAASQGKMICADSEEESEIGNTEQVATTRPTQDEEVVFPVWRLGGSRSTGRLLAITK